MRTVDKSTRNTSTVDVVDGALQVAVVSGGTGDGSGIAPEVRIINSSEAPALAQLTGSTAHNFHAVVVPAGGEPPTIVVADVPVPGAIRRVMIHLTNLGPGAFPSGRAIFVQQSEDGDNWFHCPCTAGKPAPGNATVELTEGVSQGLWLVAEVAMAQYRVMVIGPLQDNPKYSLVTYDSWLDF